MHQMLPWRPEPWSRLARLYLHERQDYEACWSYAAAGLAQGPPPPDALFLDTYAARYELRDLACTCGYYVERVSQQVGVVVVVRRRARSAAPAQAVRPQRQPGVSALLALTACV